MTEPRIIRNSAKCLKCGDEIESVHRHDFRSCGCGAVCVDGGKAYTRRAWKSPNGEKPEDVFTDTSIYGDAA